MPDQLPIKKAVLQQIAWNEEGTVTTEGPKFEVQFNPETMNLAFSNQIDGGDQAGGSAIQFNSKGTTKLTFDLIFDVTDPKIAQRFKGDNKPTNTSDVRRITKLVADFMQTERTGSGQNVKFTPPGIRFSWGTFRFEGVVDSLTEKLEFFSAQGVPLRATVSVSITKQDVDINFNAPANDSQGAPNAGTEETAAPGANDNTMPDQINKNGTPKPWQGDALANGIENPLDLPLGEPLSLGGELAASLNASLEGSAGVGLSAGLGDGIGGSLGGSFGGSIGGGIGLSATAGIAGGLSGGVSAGVGLGGGLDLGGSVGFDGGLDIGSSLDAGIGGGGLGGSFASSDGLGVDIASGSNFDIDASTELALSGDASSRFNAGLNNGVDFDSEAEFNF